MGDESHQSGSSIGAVLTRGIECLAVICIPTGNEITDRQHVYLVFSAHIKADPDDPESIVAPAIMFFPTISQAVELIMEQLDESRFAENHPGEMYDSSNLNTYSARILVANDPETIGRHIADADEMLNSTTTPPPENKRNRAAANYAEYAYSFRNGDSPPLATSRAAQNSSHTESEP